MSEHDDSQLRLKHSERNSDVWHKLRAFLETRLEEHRAKLESDQATEATTKLRGRIAELKAIIAAAEEE